MNDEKEVEVIELDKAELAQVELREEKELDEKEIEDWYSTIYGMYSEEDFDDEWRQFLDKNT